MESPPLTPSSPGSSEASLKRYNESVMAESQRSLAQAETLVEHLENSSPIDQTFEARNFAVNANNANNEDEGGSEIQSQQELRPMQAGGLLEDASEGEQDQMSEEDEEEIAQNNGVPRRIRRNELPRYKLAFNSTDFLSPFKNFAIAHARTVVPRPSCVLYQFVSRDDVHQRDIRYGEFLSDRFILDETRKIYVVQQDGPRGSAMYQIVAEAKIDQALGRYVHKFVCPSNMALGDRMLNGTKHVKDAMLDGQLFDQRNEEAIPHQRLGMTPMEIELEEMKDEHEAFLETVENSKNGKIESVHITKERMTLGELFKNSVFHRSVPCVVPFEDKPLYLHTQAGHGSWNIALKGHLVLFKGFGMRLHDRARPDRIKNLAGNGRVLASLKYLLKLVLDVFCRGNIERYWWFMSNLTTQYLHPLYKTSKFLFCVGPPGCGKTTLITWLYHTVPGKELSLIAPNLERAGLGEKFGHPGFGKKFCVVEEVDETKFSTSAFKHFVSSEEQVSETKFGDTAPVLDYWNFVGTCNVIPPIELNERRKVIFVCQRSDLWDASKVLAAVRDEDVRDLMLALCAGDYKALGNKDAKDVLGELGWWIKDDSYAHKVQCLWSGFVREKVQERYSENLSTVKSFSSNWNEIALRVSPFSEGELLSWTRITHNSTVAFLVNSVARQMRMDTTVEFVNAVFSLGRMARFRTGVKRPRLLPTVDNNYVHNSAFAPYKPPNRPPLAVVGETEDAVHVGPRLPVPIFHAPEADTFPRNPQIAWFKENDQENNREIWYPWPVTDEAYTKYLEPHWRLSRISETLDDETQTVQHSYVMGLQALSEGIVAMLLATTAKNSGKTAKANSRHDPVAAVAKSAKQIETELALFSGDTGETFWQVIPDFKVHHNKTLSLLKYEERTTATDILALQNVKGLQRRVVRFTSASQFLYGVADYLCATMFTEICCWAKMFL